MEVGERFTLQSCVIEITRVRESLKAGADPLWIAEFTRHEQEKVFLLRSAPPAHADHEEQTELDAAAIKKAAAESAYTSSQHGALPNEPESVGPDWEDTGKGQREIRRQAARAALKAEETSRVELRRFKARAAQVMLASGRCGRDLTPLLEDIFARLETEEREAQEAA